jgi:iron(III) transport system substrate-binding protein
MKIGLIALAGVLALAAGCGGSGTGKAIVLYNGQHQQLTSAMVSAFETGSGVQVRMRSNDGVVLADQILQEGSHSPADVILTENSPELMELEEHGLLAKLDRRTLDQVPPDDRSPAGEWVGVSLRVSTLVYDPTLVAASSLPDSILALADPRWKGKVAIAPLDSDFPPVVGAVIATKGLAAARTWLAGLKRNAVTYQDEESVVSAVDRGNVASGVVNQYYWYRLHLEQGKTHSALHAFASGDPGSIVNVSGVGVLASSHDQANARRFVSFLVSAGAQRLIGQGDDFEYPARPGVAANPALPPLATFGDTRLSAVALGDDQQAARLIESAGFGG